MLEKQKELLMKVENVLIKPPSLVARLEGKANKALVEEAKEAIQKAEEKSRDKSNDANQVAQGLVDLLA